MIAELRSFFADTFVKIGIAGLLVFFVGIAIYRAVGHAGTPMFWVAYGCTVVGFDAFTAAVIVKSRDNTLRMPLGIVALMMTAVAITALVTN